MLLGTRLIGDLSNKNIFLSEKEMALNTVHKIVLRLSFDFFNL